MKQQTLSRQDIMNIISRIHEYAKQGEFSSIEKELDQITVNSDPQLMVTLLRSSFAFKDKLSNYDTQLQKATAYLISQNLNPQTVLIGLIPKA